MARALTTKRRSRKDERLEARLTPQQKHLITRAAALRGFTVTDFVVASAEQAASQAIKDFQALTLHDSDSEVFVNAILHPPAPNSAARLAAKRYKKRMRK